MPPGVQPISRYVTLFASRFHDIKNIYMYVCVCVVDFFAAKGVEESEIRAFEPIHAPGINEA